MTAHHIHWAAHAVFLADLVVRLAFSVRVIRRRLPVGTSLAWLGIILIFPFVGAVVYLLLGESRLGPLRARRAAAYREASPAPPSQPGDEDRAAPATLGLGGASVARLARSTLGAPLLEGNRLELLAGADEAFPA